MRLIAVVAAMLAISAAPASAQDAPDPARENHLTLAGRYLELTQGGEMVKQMRQQIEESYAESEMPAEQRTWMIESMSDALTDVVAQTIAELRDDVADTFTVPELEAAIGFYESPMGRAVIRKQADLSFEAQEIMMPLLLPRMTAVMEKFCVRFDCEALGEAAAKEYR